MRFFQLTVISIAVLFLTACVETTTTKVYTIKTSITTSQADIDLLIAKAKLDERTRIMAELAKQAKQDGQVSKLRLEELASQCKAVNVAEVRLAKPKKVNPLIEKPPAVTTQPVQQAIQSPATDSVIRHCQVFQLIPEPYNGSLRAVLDKSTEVRGNTQLLPTLCKYSRSPGIIKKLQQSLQAHGYLKSSPPYDLVVVDGVWGINTLSAVRAYQKDHGLAYGQLSIEVLKHLKVL